MDTFGRGFHTTDKRFNLGGSRVGTTDNYLGQGTVDLRTVDKHLEDLKKFQTALERKHEFNIKATSFRKAMMALVDSTYFNGIIMTVILINALLLVLSTWRSIERYANFYFTTMDGVFLGVYIVEAVLKIYVWRFQYFKNGWDIFDLVIVSTSLLELVAPLTVGTAFLGGGTSIFRILRVLRALRSLRVLRTIQFLENIQVILVTCLHSFKSLGAIMMLMALVLVIFAVIGRGLFETVDRTRFGNFGVATFTLVQLLTLDDWFEIFTDITDKRGYFDGSMFFFLLLYIIIEYFVFLNLFIAVLVDNFQLTLHEKLLRKEEEKEGQESDNRNHEDDDEGSVHSSSDTEYNIPKITREFLIQGGDEESIHSDNTEDFDRNIPNYFPHATKEEIALLEAYYQILPALEKECHLNYNAMACHDRILELSIDPLGMSVQRQVKRIYACLLRTFPV